MGEENVYKVKIKEDLTGKKFTKLTVIKRAPDNFRIKKNGIREYYANWYCNCDCGKTDVIVKDYYLRKGLKKSCGCLKNAGHIFVENDYNLNGDYGIGYTNKKEEFYFDLEDYDKIRNFRWWKNAYGYIVAYERGAGRKNARTIQMQWIITDLLNCDHNRIIIDHINGIRSDNRKSNLRIVNRTENNMNRKIQRNNTSGCTGVYWSDYRNRWVACIELFGKHIHLGVFKKYDDAVKARKNAEEIYFGEYSYDNSRNKPEVI